VSKYPRGRRRQKLSQTASEVHHTLHRAGQLSSRCSSLSSVKADESDDFLDEKRSDYGRILDDGIILKHLLWTMKMDEKLEREARNYGLLPRAPSLFFDS
jgi:hypothetical protein